MPTTSFACDAAIADTRLWLDRAVIGLNLCPFAKAVQVRGQVHYAASDSGDWDTVLAQLLDEARALLACDAAVRDTTLLVLVAGLGDFYEFNEFTAWAEQRLAGEGFEGVLQLASFHPRFQFEGTDADDIGNATNRAPWPTLHLLREASMDRAVAAFPEAETIYERNIGTLERLGDAGWQALDLEPGCAARASGPSPRAKGAA